MAKYFSVGLIFEQFIQLRQVGLAQEQRTVMDRLFRLIKLLIDPCRPVLRKYSISAGLTPRRGFRRAVASS
jgi:hypothetical protein